MASRSKHSKDKKSESTADQEETTVKKRKLEVDTVPAQSFEVPRKVRDQANLIACFAKEACELGIKNPTNLTQENKAALKKKLPTDLEETRLQTPRFWSSHQGNQKRLWVLFCGGYQGEYLGSTCSFMESSFNACQNLRLYYY